MSSPSLFRQGPGEKRALRLHTCTFRTRANLCFALFFRHVLLLEPVCFDEGLSYTVRLSLPLYSSVSYIQNPYTLIDSVRPV